MSWEALYPSVDNAKLALIHAISKYFPLKNVNRKKKTAYPSRADGFSMKIRFNLQFDKEISLLQFVEFHLLVVKTAVLAQPLTVVVEVGNNIFQIGLVLKLAVLLGVEVLYFLLGQSLCCAFVPIGALWSLLVL